MTDTSVETVVIVYDKIDNRILLGMKKTGFGSGKWNGFGGKFDPSKDKNIKDTARRELMEETGGINGIIPLLMGIITFRFPENPDEKVHEVHFFRIDTFMGEAKETEEMRPKWFPLKDIPYNQMWADDAYWMPLLLKNKKFKGEMSFSKSGEILSGSLKVVESL